MTTGHGKAHGIALALWELENVVGATGQGTMGATTVRGALDEPWKALQSLVRRVASGVWARAMTISELKILEMVFRIDVSQATSSRVLFIGVSHNTSMIERL
uniref:Uncharacterized protein n=1 Tax=Solanum tuberosum TaxID=4113 RepID=M1DXH6_SOLTU